MNVTHLLSLFHFISHLTRLRYFCLINFSLQCFAFYGCGVLCMCCEWKLPSCVYLAVYNTFHREMKNKIACIILKTFVFSAVFNILIFSLFLSMILD